MKDALNDMDTDERGDAKEYAEEKKAEHHLSPVHGPAHVVSVETPTVAPSIHMRPDFRRSHDANPFRFPLGGPEHPDQDETKGPHRLAPVTRVSQVR